MGLGYDAMGCGAMGGNEVGWDVRQWGGVGWIWGSGLPHLSGALPLGRGWPEIPVP